MTELGQEIIARLRKFRDDLRAVDVKRDRSREAWGKIASDIWESMGYRVTTLVNQDRRDDTH